MENQIVSQRKSAKERVVTGPFSIECDGMNIWIKFNVAEGKRIRAFAIRISGEELVGSLKSVTQKAFRNMRDRRNEKMSKLMRDCLPRLVWEKK